ncbi:glycosyltransferase [Anaerobacillus alkalidiazotrophicus]|uniref:glycosyltransferase n=1 Tax=Anaerobacillus alkalidiazotrophicus TaxID=472963 RepID=UPI001FE24025|nr:glycosyltransferase [Anaerobacillus alkalidiazotrophicus]
MSIIIPFYNCAYIDQAVQSALNQTYKNIEVIVVDDGSTQYTHKLQRYLRKIKYIKKENGGTASALNTGIRNASGKYFAWLSSDDLYLPRKIEKQLKYMIKNNFDVSYTPVIKINNNSKPISKPIGYELLNKVSFYHTMQRGCVINGCTVMMKMKVFSDIGLFNEKLLYTQDYDLWLRVMQKYDFHYLPAPLVYYRIHEQMGTKKYDQAIKEEVQFVQQKHMEAINHLIQKTGN